MVIPGTAERWLFIKHYGVVFPAGNLQKCSGLFKGLWFSCWKSSSQQKQG